MNINTNEIVTMAEANQNFSEVAKAAERNGRVLIFENNRPKYEVIDLDKTSDDEFEITDDEKIDVAAARIMKKYHAAFEELAK